VRTLRYLLTLSINICQDVLQCVVNAFKRINVLWTLTHVITIRLHSANPHLSQHPGHYALLIAMKDAQV
jgi:hypothetical protein